MESVLHTADVCDAREALLVSPVIRSRHVYFTANEFASIVKAFLAMEKQIKAYQSKAEEDKMNAVLASQPDYPTEDGKATIGALLDRLKIIKEGYGKECVIDYIKIGNHIFASTHMPRIIIEKEGRGLSRRLIMVFKWDDYADKELAQARSVISKQDDNNPNKEITNNEQKD